MSALDALLQPARALLAARGLEALLLQRVSSFAWVTGGAASYVNTAATTGAAAALLTPAGAFILADNIETPRLEQEEHLAADGWTMVTGPWHAASGAVARLTTELRLAADGPYPGAVDLSAEVAALRCQLSPAAIEQFQVLGQAAGEAVGAAAQAVRPGMTELEIGAHLSLEAQRRGVQPIVVLVATDDRIARFRHPLPTGRRLERCAMLVLCGRQRGLVASLTRLVHFGPLPAGLRRKAEVVAQIDATLMAATRPGATLGEVFEQGVAAYAQTGYPDEWQNHHQGGPAAYEPRELIATPGAAFTVQAGQAYAWNPSVTGAKSEDTILVGAAGRPNALLTPTPGWPQLNVTVGGQTIARPAIWER